MSIEEKSYEDMEWVNTHSPQSIQIENKNKIKRENSTTVFHRGVRSVMSSLPITSLDCRYFEVKITNGGIVGIGLATKDIGLKDWPGLTHESSSSGYMYYAKDMYSNKGILWQNGVRTECNMINDTIEVIGCGVDDKDTLFFTVNGTKLDVTFNVSNKILYPIASLYLGVEVVTNFANEKFVYEAMNQPKVSFPPMKTFLEEWMDKFVTAKNAKQNIVYENLNDVTIVSKDEEKIGCHRLILSVRSKVFSAMFQHESYPTSEVHITEFDAATVRKMIKFIYTDSIDEKQETVDFELLAIAHKYDIKALQIFCEKTLSHQLDAENVLDVWRSANLLQSSDMIQSCESFIRKNWEKIEKTEAYSSLMKDNKEDVIKLLVGTVNPPKDPMMIALLNVLK